MESKTGVTFHKYNSVGDDLIVVDNRDGHFDDYADDTDFKALMCDRTVGIGANGIMEIRPHETCLYEAIFYDGKGKREKTCGDGTRATIVYANEAGLVQPIGKEFKVMLYDGVHIASCDPKTMIPTMDIKVKGQILDLGEYFFAHTGTPHLVTFVDDISAVECVRSGRILSKVHANLADCAPCVNFVQETKKGLVPICYESFIDDEVFACGTGSVAVAICHAFKQPPGCKPKGRDSRIVIWPYGVSTVEFEWRDGQIADITLAGASKRVFSGKYFAK